MPESRLRLAVFIDFDNIEIGVKNTLNTQFDAGLVLEALKERGEVVSKTAYSDWQRAGDYSRLLTQHAIKMVQRNLTPGGDKNGADINLALDALEMAFTHPHINAFVIVGGDSDFISLLEKLKQYDKKVFVVGGRQFTSNIMQKNCHEFIAYENLLSTSRRQQGGRQQKSGDRQPSLDRQPIEQSLALVKRALKVLSEREVSPQLGLLKSTLLQLDSTFSERTYGAGSFRDFVEKLEKLGLVTVKQEGRDLLVELRDGFEMPDVPAVAEKPAVHEKAAPHEKHERHAAPAAQAADPAKAAEGVSEVRRILTAAKATMRWPLYIRQMKQVLKTNAPGFDERTFGFASLVDLLRAAQKDGLVRMERDRQGAVRLFQGQALQGAPGSELTSGYAAAAEGDTRVEDAGASDPHDVESAVPVNLIDRTAEALGMGHGAPRGRRRAPHAAQGKAEAEPAAKAAKKPARAAKPKAEKAPKAAKAEAKPKVERRRSPRKPKDTAADSSTS
ncbi:MAG TPA: NYN domain-containing protein [Vicinamibacterales bacterium]|nr:NYN domain-containing protein [Vicinamibacterales bacterium]